MTQGTVNACKELGYTEEQSKLIGQIDDLFEEAVKLDLVSPTEAIKVGMFFGEQAGKHTGKIK